MNTDLKEVIAQRIEDDYCFRMVFSEIIVDGQPTDLDLSRPYAVREWLRSSGIIESKTEEGKPRMESFMRLEGFIICEMDTRDPLLVLRDVEYDVESVSDDGFTAYVSARGQKVEREEYI